MEKIIVSCLESRVERNRSMYARFLLGPFKDDQAITIATALRRSLLSKVKSIAITAIHIQGVTHEFSTIVGVRESVLDLALNFQQVVLRTQRNKELPNTDSLTSAKAMFVPPHKQSLSFSVPSEQVISPQIGYLQVQGPAVIYANDLKLPVGVECVDPTQYIATLSTEGLLVVKFLIGEKKECFDNNKKKLKRKQEFCRSFDSTTKFRPDKSNPSNNFKLRSTSYSTIGLRNTMFLDPVFDSVFKVNYVIEKDDLFNKPRERILLELWTNGSVHPRQALHKASLYLISTFSVFRNVFHLDSV